MNSVTLVLLLALTSPVDTIDEADAIQAPIETAKWSYIHNADIPKGCRWSFIHKAVICP